MAHDEQPVEKFNINAGNTKQTLSVKTAAANGSNTVTISNVAPSGVGTATIDSWLAVDVFGVTKYIPMWT